MARSGEHRTFVIKEFVKNGESVVATQRSFRRHFLLNRHDPVPIGKAIHRWVSNFRQTSSALNRRRSGRPRTKTAQENVTAVADSIEQSPRRSIRKHAFALHMSATSVHRISHRSLHTHSYKIMVVQELSERDYETRTICLKTFSSPSLRHLLQSAVMKHIFIYRGWLTNKTSDIGRKIILVNFTNDYFIVRRLPFGVLWAVLGCGILTFLKRKVLQ